MLDRKMDIINDSDDSLGILNLFTQARHLYRKIIYALLATVVLHAVRHITFHVTTLYPF